MTGIPETIPIWKQVVLNNETLLLLLLKHQGDDKFSPKTWDFLARAQLKNDGEYYQGEKHYNNLTGQGLEWGMKWDPQVDGGYHPTYIPFTPPNFGDRGSQSVFNDDTMQRFKAWTMKRASALSDTVLLTGFFTQQRNHRTHQLEPFFHIGDYGKSEQNRHPKMFSSPDLKQYSPQQMYITTVSLGEGFPKDVGIVFPGEIAGYAPRPSPSDIVRLLGDGSSTSSPPILRSELEVTVVNLEVVPPVKQTGGLRQHEPEFLFHVKPSNVKLYAKGDKEVVYEQDYSAAVSSSPQATGPIASEPPQAPRN
jgi:hypothetical protein